MIIYDTSLSSTFARVTSTTGSVVPTACLIAIPPCLAAILLAIYIPHWFEWMGESLNQAWHAFSFFVGFLLVFRTTQAYSRFWEGVGALYRMSAEWFDCASNLVTFSRFRYESCDGIHDMKVARWRESCVTLIGMLHAAALASLGFKEGEDGFEGISNLERACNRHLVEGNREQSHLTEEVLQEEDLGMFLCSSDNLSHVYHLDVSARESLRECCVSDRVSLLVAWVQGHIVRGMKCGFLEVPAPILTRSWQQLAEGVTQYHIALKICDIPFPFAYAQICDTLLLMYTTLVPIMTINWIRSSGVNSETGSAMWCGIFTYFQTLVLWTLNLIALEIEMPFGDDANDLDMLLHQNRFNRSLLLLLSDDAGHSPAPLGAMTVYKPLKEEKDDIDASLDDIDGGKVGGSPGSPTGSAGDDKRRGFLRTMTKTGVKVPENLHAHAHPKSSSPSSPVINSPNTKTASPGQNLVKQSISEEEEFVMDATLDSPSPALRNRRPSYRSDTEGDQSEPVVDLDDIENRLASRNRSIARNPKFKSSDHRNSFYILRSENHISRMFRNMADKLPFARKDSLVEDTKDTMLSAVPEPNASGDENNLNSIGSGSPRASVRRSRGSEVPPWLTGEKKSIAVDAQKAEDERIVRTRVDIQKRLLGHDNTGGAGGKVRLPHAVRGHLTAPNDDLENFETMMCSQPLERRKHGAAHDENLASAMSSSFKSIHEDTLQHEMATMSMGLNQGFGMRRSSIEREPEKAEREQPPIGVDEKGDIHTINLPNIPNTVG